MNICSLLYICSVLYIFLFSVSLADEGEDVFTVNTADQPPYSTKENTGFYDQIVIRLFEDLGMKIRINHLLSSRSIENLDLGIDDAEYARIEGLGDQYSHIRMVNERLVDFAFTAFSKDSSILIKNWGSLQKYNVGYLKGWKIYEMNVGGTKSLQVASSEEELFRMLVNDRVDVILYERLRGAAYMKRNRISGIYALQKPVAIRGMYLYLNEKHEELIPEIEKRLRVMKSSGEYQRILESFVK
nr:transporter substrate-binding domain-containing protein [Desulfopila aestuarii]